MLDCTEHIGSVGTHGYGLVQYRNRQVLDHRLAYAKHNSIDVFTMGGVVLHACDNKLCVNPEHLSLGTHADNVADKVAKGRCPSGADWNGPRGQEHYKAKLTWDDVREIRRVCVPRCKTNGVKQIASRYGVVPQLVSAIIHNQIWKENPCVVN